MKRCAWAENGALETSYHDREWGVPVRDDDKLFEMLILEGAQAGLSWSTILKKRQNYQRAFDGFKAEIIARYDEARIGQLLNDNGIVRNRMKITAAITNARAFLEIRNEYASFSAYIWQFVNGQPIVNQWTSPKEVPVTSPASDTMSRDLKRRGFKFVGSTICYAFMQAVGMVNDHTTDCFRYREILGPDPGA